MKEFKKNQYFLTNDKIDYFVVFKLIQKNIPRSIFSRLSYNFFKMIIKKKIIHIFLIKKKDKIASIISVISPKNYILLKKKIILNLILNPINFFLNLSFFISLLDRDDNPQIKGKEKQYLHLLHLIIFNKYFSDIPLKKKDNTINFFYKKIIKSFNAKFFYLCYEVSNKNAHNYYKRNNFTIYKKSTKTIFLKKKFI